MTIGKKLLEILVCPHCRGKLDPEKKEGGLFCAVCKLFYEIRDDIPILLSESATELDHDEGNGSGRNP
jgi:uncharacterized protein